MKNNSSIYLVYALVVPLIFFLLGAVLTKRITLSSMDSIAYFSKFLIPFIATYLGAYFAFLYQSRLQKKEQLLSEISQVNKFLISVYHAQTILKTLKEQYLNDDNIDSLKHPAYPEQNSELLELDASSLSFIIDEKPSLIQDFILIQNDYKTLIAALNERSVIFFNYIEPFLNTDIPHDEPMVARATAKRYMENAHYLQRNYQLIKHVQDYTPTVLNKIESFYHDLYTKSDSYFSEWNKTISGVYEKLVELDITN